MALAPVCILAGGVGSRLGEHVRDTPKPLIEVAGEPFLVHQLRLLRGHGAREIVLCVGYLGERIEEALGDGSQLGVSIAYSYDGPSALGTAGAVRAALPLLGEEFLLLYGDTYLRVDYAAVQAARAASGRPALMVVLENANRWDRSNVLFRDGVVVAHDKHHPTPDMRFIDYGLAALTPAALDAAPEASDLSDVYAELAREGRLAGFEATERFYEIGTPAALREAEEFLLAQG